MTIYSFKCMTCKEVTEKNVPMNERDKRRKCNCGGWCKRAIDKPRGVYAPTSGKGLA